MLNREQISKALEKYMIIRKRKGNYEIAYIMLLVFIPHIIIWVCNIPASPQTGTVYGLSVILGLVGYVPIYRRNNRISHELAGLICPNCQKTIDIETLLETLLNDKCQKCGDLIIGDI